MDKLEAVDIEQRMEAFPEWSVSGVTLQRTLNFDDFVAAMAFVNRLANLAESHQHHPDIMIRFNKVTLTLSTHDAGGQTEKDFEFAKAMDAGLTVT